MNGHFYLDQIDFKDNDRKELLSFFHKFRDQYTRKYISKKGTETNLFVIDGYPNQKIHKKYISIFSKWYKTSAYLANYGIEEHVDDIRKFVISFELQNIDNIPLTLDGKDVYYQNQVMAWNPQLTHYARKSDHMRIFYQIELDHNNDYNFYKNIFLTAGLYGFK